MLASVEDFFVFPAPRCSYTSSSYQRHLCWIPWNKEIWIPPELHADDAYRDHGGIPALWFPAPKAAMVIFFLHGNAEDLGMSFSFVRHMRDQFKVNVLAVEYPGYGQLSDVRGSEDSLNAIVLTTFRFIVDQLNVSYENIILFGRSIGTGPSCTLASKYPIGGLILVGAFLSIKFAIQDIAGRFVASLCNDKFPNIVSIQNVTCPTLLIHGDSDAMIPVRHSIELFRRCRTRKLLVTPPKMEHNSNLFSDSQFLAVPTINFFGLPGYCTSTPPRIPAQFFVHPIRPDSPLSWLSGSFRPWAWCGIADEDTRKDIGRMGSTEQLAVSDDLAFSELSTTLSEAS